MGKKEEALDCYEKRLSLDPAHAGAWLLYNIFIEKCPHIEMRYYFIAKYIVYDEIIFKEK